MSPKKTLVIACSLALCGVGQARADAVGDLKAQMDQLQRQLDAVKAQLHEMQEKEQKQAQAPMAPAGASFVQTKPGSATTFLTPGGGEVQLYGFFDVSVDMATKGLQSDYGANGGMPVGKMGWQPDISTNLSRVGAKGKQPITREDSFIWQLEAGIDISATPGTKISTSNNSDAVNGALFSRNSFIGFAGKEWGAVMVGKNETPYKTSTDPLNPFSGQVGDYRSIMGNTGGDNRVEFGLRASHAIWYDSPHWSGASIHAMYSPGQNRDDTSSIVASGEPDCTGGNIPGSGATPPTCNDGSFGDLFSVSGIYSQGPIYLTAAYELHKNVNRTSDLGNLDPRDIADEKAFKVGGKYTLPSKTTLIALWERTKRSLPADLEGQNERDRPNAYWLAVTQGLDGGDSVSLGWAHAGKSIGVSGVHNTAGDPNNFDNSSNMYSFTWKHHISKSVMFYVAAAMQDNHADAHYDLGAGGHGVTTDCHDSSPMAAFDATTGTVSNDGPHCYAGGKLKAVSVGATYGF